MVTWEAKTFAELTAKEFYDVFYERIRTFVVAQQRIYQELDAVDKTARHLLGYQGGKLVAYARVFRTDDHATFGRVLTVPEVRGQGLGRQLMQQITTELARHFADQPVVIEAQVDKQGFYEKFNHMPVGQPFLFQHTPHIKMQRRD
ncbi:GNAT family N-acetyltransferase [Levilactobacillus suantsaii]|uniref:GNAT family N-acetyltransferase n=1 Tax=Levilactobacillus suantsaii TaxID=2292255 RepID=A0A4Q0VK74_9LACO|nr:GNAT family N-acetyltransferase [Levilactobacillus suantsaii]RXI78457.1 GNAT family N-acetyltransferase [Levilactobacillus suantsaii]